MKGFSELAILLIALSLIVGTPFFPFLTFSALDYIVLMSKENPVCSQLQNPNVYVTDKTDV